MSLEFDDKGNENIDNDVASVEVNSSLSLNAIPLRNNILYLGGICPIFIGRNKSLSGLRNAIKNKENLFLAIQKNADTYIVESEDLYKYGVIVQILHVIERYDQSVQVLIEVIAKAELVSFELENNEYKVTVVPVAQSVVAVDQDAESQVMMKELIERFQKIVVYDNRVPNEVVLDITKLKDLNQVIYNIAKNLYMPVNDAYFFLEEDDVRVKFDKLCLVMKEIQLLLEAEFDIKSRIKEKISNLISNDKVFIKTDMAVKKVIDDGDDIKFYKNYEEDDDDDIDIVGEYDDDSHDKEMDGSDVHEGKKKSQSEIEILVDKAKNVKFSEEAQEKFDEEIKKLQATPAMSSEAVVIRNYLQYLVDLPWNNNKDLNFDLRDAKSVLDKHHYGLNKIKDRILEYLSVFIRVKKLKGNILCLIGPPGVGKTSLAKAIAESMGRPFVKVSLGGIRDEAEIRGHRRTYLGAMPGAIIAAVKKAKYNNPLVLLDEIDKLSYDHRGDPSSALLEVLDSEQNLSFNDHYLEVGYDLSDVMFLATSNSMNFSYPLRDRMDIINLSGYTEDEKILIARKYLLSKLFKEMGMTEDEFKLSDGVLIDIIRYYTRESGVRGLERECATLMRKALRKIIENKDAAPIKVTRKNLDAFLGVKKYSFGELEDKHIVGIVTGLAYTEMGGDILTIEVIKSLSHNKNGGGNITATGKLGDVMKESIKATFNFIKSQAYILGVAEEDLSVNNLHIHFPEGAVPKDGPSAGIGIYTAIVSVLTNIEVKRDVAMTGEISLRGRVLPIGGLKEKLLGALRSGVKTVIIPEKNAKDLKEIPDDIKGRLKIVLVDRVEDVLKEALMEKIQPIQPKSDKLSS